jgi:hypothetical protein
MGFTVEDTGGGTQLGFTLLVTQTVSGLGFYLYMLFVDRCRLGWGQYGGLCEGRPVINH